MSCCPGVRFFVVRDERIMEGAKPGKGIRRAPVMGSGRN
jgi:hypothetical protein